MSKQYSSHRPLTVRRFLREPRLRNIFHGGEHWADSGSDGAAYKGISVFQGGLTLTILDNTLYIMILHLKHDLDNVRNHDSNPKQLTRAQT